MSTFQTAQQAASADASNTKAAHVATSAALREASQIELAAKDEKVEQVQRNTRQRVASELLPLQHVPALHQEVLLGRIFSFLGPGRYLFVACVCKLWSEKYDKAFKTRTNVTAAVSTAAFMQHALHNGFLGAINLNTFSFATSVLRGSSEPIEVMQVLPGILNLGLPRWSAAAVLYHEAVEQGDNETSQWLLDHGCPTKDDRAVRWRTAADKGDLQELQWLNKHGYTCYKHAEDDGTSLCRNAAEKGQLQLLQWYRQQGCSWSTGTTYQAALNGHLATLQWLLLHGCPDHYQSTLVGAASRGQFDVLKWLQQHGEPWSEDDKSRMLFWAVYNSRDATTMWLLNEAGAAWPNSFMTVWSGGRYCWRVEDVKRAWSNGCSWAVCKWDCKQLAQELCTDYHYKWNAAAVFEWAHANGCPCSCTPTVAAAAPAAVQIK